jgi:hypothetical protein
MLVIFDNFFSKFCTYEMTGYLPGVVTVTDIGSSTVNEIF